MAFKFDNVKMSYNTEREEQIYLSSEIERVHEKARLRQMLASECVCV